MSLHHPGLLQQLKSCVLCSFCPTHSRRSHFVFAAPVREVNIVQVNDRITCSSERVYPEPTLSWSTSPQEPPNPEVQQMEDQLYKSNSTNVNYSCTVSASRNRRKTTLFQPRRPILPLPEQSFTEHQFKATFMFSPSPFKVKSTHQTMKQQYPAPD